LELNIYERYGRLAEEHENLKVNFSNAVLVLKAVVDGQLSTDRITFTEDGFTIAAEEESVVEVPDLKVVDVHNDEEETDA
jgi:hypothetical protein